MVPDASRRRVLLAVGAATAGLAGCLESQTTAATDEDHSTPDDDQPGQDPTVPADDDPGDEDEQSGDVPDDRDPVFRWPAIQIGDVITDFEPDTHWEPLIGDTEPTHEEARTGTQAVRAHSDSDKAAFSLAFPDGLDLDGWNTSMAVKVESLTTIAIEFHAPEFDDHLTSFYQPPRDYDDWLRIDFGYNERAGDPDLTNVAELRVIGFGPSAGPTRFVADDLRRTPATTDTGKAILACYGGRTSHYDILAPRLADRNWPAVVPINPRSIGGSNRMTLEELHELHDRGWDISPAPRGSDGLSGLPEPDQRAIIETARNDLIDAGFPDGARHFFAPDWRRMDPTNHALVRDLHETGFVFGTGTTSIPPTNPHMIATSWAPALRGGIRRYINIADQYHGLTVLRIPPIVTDDDSHTDNNMHVDDLDHLLDHIHARGLDVITPSDLIDTYAYA